ncbi:MATE efflux family protein [Lichtheimia hyalospora FSU 10163]|nr:MATE efflux family protein [Lichtheimia hyalospora FSU 10163]
MGRLHPSTTLHAAIKETISILALTWPLLITFVVGYGMKLVDVWFLGRLDTEVMAVVSLSNLWCTVGGFAMGNGLLTAIDTLVAQAFTAATNPTTLGIILQRGLLIMACVAAPISILWMFAESILVSIGQEPDLAHLAQKYIYFCIPFVYMVFVSTAVRKFLQSLGKMRVTMFMCVSLFPLNYLSNLVWLKYMHLGYVGAAMHFATFHTMVFVVYMIFLLGGTKFARSYWPGWSQQALYHWKPFLKLGIPGMLSVATDWAFEVCALLSGTLGKTSLAGQSIVLTINSLLLMIPSALSNAVLVRAGHHLGAGRSEQIRMCFMLSTTFGILLSLINAISMYTFRSWISHYFAIDPEVVQAAVNLFPVAACCHFFAGVSAIFSAMLTALGKQPVVASFNLGSYYAIGMPFGLWITYTYDWGLEGIWSGVAVAGIIKCIGEGAMLLYYVDWENECQKVGRVIGSQEITISSTTKALPITKNSNDTL